jgi:polysaccharide chain length determinant protein (PEP-CTERM system associated)
MIPGKPYRPEDFLRAAWRRRWMILVPIVLAAVGTAVWSLGQPDEYKSETTLLVVPPSGAGNLVTGSNDVVPIEDRLYTIRQQVVSHDRLKELVESAGLYAAWRQAHPESDVVNRMRQDVDIAIVKGNPRRIDGNFFKISFISTNAQTAAMVTNRLADLLVSENVADRKDAARATTAFIETQLVEARNKLEAQESRIEAYRQRYASEQPSMLASNLETIRRTESQLQSIESALSADRGQRLALESMIAAAQVPVPAGTTEVRRRPAEVAGAAIGVQLDAARSELKALELHLTSEHPDVVTARRKVRELEERARAEGVPQSADGGLLSAAEVDRRQRLQELQAQMKSLEQQISDKEQSQPRLRQVIATYQARVDATPTREAEFAALTRDQATLQTVYQRLLASRENSGIASKLEADQAERFRVIEPAQVPTKPFRPNRPQFIYLGALFGLGLGIGLVGLFEYRDSSLRSDADVLAALGLPVLAMIPVMNTTNELTGRKYLRTAISVLVGLTTLVIALVWKSSS